VANWFDMTEKELHESEEAQQQKQLAYCNTFYATDEGRLVMADLRRRIYSSGGLEPVAVIALIEFLEHIRTNCGLVDAKAITDAEASTIISK